MNQAIRRAGHHTTWWLLLVIVLTGGAGEAHAQVVNLYKNVQDNFIEYVIVGDITGLTTRRQHAMAFTTGDNAAGGYTLSAVKIWVHFHNKTENADPPVPGGMPKVSIYTNSSGSPGTSKYVLTTPTFTYSSQYDDYGYAAVDFNAPASATLDASTTYFVVFEDTGADGYWELAMQHLTNTLETAASGWSAGTRYLRKDGTGAWGATGFDRKIYMELTGTIDDTTAPTLNTATVDGTSLVLTYDEALDGSSRPVTNDYTVNVDGSPVTISSIAVNGSTVTLTLGTAVTSNQAVTVTYAVPTTNPVQDASENAVAALMNQNVTNNSNESPMFSASSTTRSFEETVGDATISTATNVGTPVTATDGDNDAPFYSLEGQDAAKFTIDTVTGQIQTKVGESYDREAKSSYAVVVKADDNRGGTGSIAVTISVDNVAEKPLAPAVPTVTSVSGSTTSLNVTWTAPANSGRPTITSYDLQYKKTTAITWTDGPQNQTGTSANIGSLEAETDYEVQVRATNADGDSDWSSPGTGQTNAPANESPMFSSSSTTRSFEETVGDATVSTAASVGTPVTATDGDDDTLTYSLEGQDAAKFTIDTVGQIQTKVGESYDREAKSSYAVVVKADDSKGGTDSIEVTVNVTNVPEFVSANVPTTGAFVEIEFDSQLSSVLPPLSALTVTADGETAEFHSSTPISVQGGTNVHLRMKNLIREGQTITVSYTDPTPGNDTNAIQDGSGIDAPSFTDEPATNDSTEQPGVPSPIPDLTVTIDASNRFELTWATPVDNGGRIIVGYWIEWSADWDLLGASAVWQNVSANTGSQLTRHIHTPLPGQTRSYRVSAINSEGTGAVSNVVTVTSRTGDGTPSAPRRLMATAAHRQIDLSWEPPGYEGEAGDAITGYKIEGSTDGGTNWTDLVADTGTTATTYAHTNLDYGTQWHYRVSAINSVGAGQTATVDATTLNRNTPTAPLNLRTILSPTQVTLNWDPPADDGGSIIRGYVYRLIYETGPGGWVLALLVHERSVYEHFIRELNPGQTYTIEFRAYNENGQGEVIEVTVTLPLVASTPSGPNEIETVVPDDMEMVPNIPPVVAIPLVDQAVMVNAPFSYVMAEGTFTDADGDPLTYSASLSDGTALPAWLSSAPETGTFSGTPGLSDTGRMLVRVTASDGLASVSDEFALTVDIVDE